MSAPRISFSWKPTVSGREKWRWGLFMVVPERSGPGNRLRIMVRGLLLWLAGLGLAAYLAAATALFVWLERRPFNLVTWSDCALAPVRWPEIQRKLGDGYIAAGLRAMDAMNWSEAELRIRAGLAKSPDNRRGRERLARFYVAAGQRERGLNLLVEGMQRSFPGREQLETFLNLCLAGEDYGTALRGLEACLAHQSGAVERERVWLADQKTRVLMGAERFPEALDWIDQQESLTELTHESRVVALVQLQRFEEARAALADWEEGSGSVSGGSLRVAVRLARDEGRVDEMQHLLGRLRQRSLTDPSPWIYAVIQNSLAGQEAEAESALEDFFMRFETKPGAMARVAQPLIEIGNWALFEQVSARARLLRQEGDVWQHLRLEAAIRRGRYEEALALIQEIEVPEDDSVRARQLRYLKPLQEALVRHLQNGEAGSGEALLQQVRQGPVALSILKQYADANEHAGNGQTALRLMEIASQRFPGSADVQARIERLRREVGASEQGAVELPVVRDGTPVDLGAVGLPEPTEESQATARSLASARLFLTRADEMVDAGQWSELENLFRALRRARPLWMDGSGSELLLREIELNLGLRNWPALISNVRFRLDGTLPRALEVMSLVRRLDLAGERETAERVLVEVERQHENFPPARRQREDWAAADEKAREAAEAEEGGAEGP